MKTLYTVSLKQRGHDLIDELVALGINRTRVYFKLAHWMGKKQRDVHFRAVNDDASLQKMVKHLERFLRNERLKQERQRIKYAKDMQGLKQQPLLKRAFIYLKRLYRRIRYKIKRISAKRPH